MQTPGAGQVLAVHCPGSIVQFCTALSLVRLLPAPFAEQPGKGEPGITITCLKCGRLAPASARRPSDVATDGRSESSFGESYVPRTVLIGTGVSRVNRLMFLYACPA